jgi:hypothetical protein
MPINCPTKPKECDIRQFKCEKAINELSVAAPLKQHSSNRFLSTAAVIHIIVIPPNLQFINFFFQFPQRNPTE